jgi:Cu2+-exporting ATPase
MFLLGLEVLIISYVGVRIADKIKDEKKNKVLIKKKNNVQTKTPMQEKKSLKVTKTIDTKEEKNIHYIKTSSLAILFSLLTKAHPIFLPLSLATLTYSSIPYLREVENSVRKKKIDIYILFGITDIATLALGHLATASYGVTSIHIFNFLTNKVKKDSEKSLINIYSNNTSKVWVKVNGIELETSISNIKKDDILVLKTGDIIPVDGIITKGFAMVNEQKLTGECQSREKVKGDTIFASTQLAHGSLHIKVQKSGEDTTVAKITNILNHSTDFKTNTQLKGEVWADKGVLPMLGLSLVSLPFIGPVGSVALLNADIAQNIRIVAPLSTLNYLTLASRKNILVKDGRVLEDLSSIDTFLFDKTGTLTEEEPEVARILVFLDEYTEIDILTYAAMAETKLQHPIAKAILTRAKKEGIVLAPVDNSDYVMGYGVSVKIDGKLIQVGSHRFMEQEGIEIPVNLDKEMESAYEEGNSLIMIAIDKKFAGILEMKASIRPEVKDLLKNLRKNGVKHIAIISGDHKQPTQKLAKTLEMDDYFYDVLPQDKAKIVEDLQKQGKKVCFIGDGVNDTIAMKKANISISLSGASSVATDTAQIILMNGSLIQLNELIELSHDLNKNLKRGWLLNSVPGTLTVIYAFSPHATILGAIILGEVGLFAGIINSLSPLRKVKSKKSIGRVNQ